MFKHLYRLLADFTNLNQFRTVLNWAYKSQNLLSLPRAIIIDKLFDFKKGEPLQLHLQEKRFEESRKHSRLAAQSAIKNGLQCAVVAKVPLGFYVDTNRTV